MNTSELLRGALGRREPAKVLDSADDDTSALSGADDYTIADISMAAVAAIQQWVETDDLDQDESYADRLVALFVGIADANKDDDITGDEQGVLEVALNAAWDYLVGMGAAEDDVDALLNDWDDEVAGRVRDLVACALPDGEDEASAGIDDFVFSGEDQAPVLDAAYRRVLAIRGGKKVRIRKRVSGKVRLTGRQKMAIRRARMKSHSAGAMMRRMKSMRLRRKAGL